MNISWPRRRTIVALALSGLALGAGGGILAVASQDAPERVDELSTARLGSSFSILDNVEDLPVAPNPAGPAIAANPRAGVPDAAATPARRLASHKGAGLILMPGDGSLDRVCFMTTGQRFLVRCADRADLASGRIVLSVPLAKETPETITTTPRVDFLIVPDEVVSVATADGPAVSISGNVAIAERPAGGAMGTVDYRLRDGRGVSLEFATAGP